MTETSVENCRVLHDCVFDNTGFQVKSPMTRSYMYGSIISRFILLSHMNMILLPLGKDTCNILCLATLKFANQVCDQKCNDNK